MPCLLACSVVAHAPISMRMRAITGSVVAVVVEEEEGRILLQKPPRKRPSDGDSP
jgi:hypothetical protein